MVMGIERFVEHFSGFETHYAVIGGAACELLFGEAGLEFRGTKDIDMVICVDTVDAAFSQRFLSFITSGGYDTRERSDGKREYYRFIKPKAPDYPYMLELFTKRSGGLSLPADAVITRVLTDDDAASLSAILLDDEYYRAIDTARRVISGVSLIDATLLIPFKARAFLDLSARRADGQGVDSREIRKHRGDIIRLSQLLDPEAIIDFGQAIQNDMRDFLRELESDPSIDPKVLGVRASISNVILELRRAYAA